MCLLPLLLINQEKDNYCTFSTHSLQQPVMIGAAHVGTPGLLQAYFPSAREVRRPCTDEVVVRGRMVVLWGQILWNVFPIPGDPPPSLSTVVPGLA